MERSENEMKEYFNVCHELRTRILIPYTGTLLTEEQLTELSYILGNQKEKLLKIFQRDNNE